MVFVLLFTISNIVALCVNFDFSNMVLHVLPSSILIIAKPDISSMNRTFTLINFCSLGFRTMHSFRKMVRDLFRNLKQQSHEFITPSNFKHILIPNTRSTFSWISETRVYISNLCPCMSIITGIINNTLTN